MSKVRIDLKEFFSQGHFMAQFPNTKVDDFHNSMVSYLEQKHIIGKECEDSGEAEAEFIFYNKDSFNISAMFFGYGMIFGELKNVESKLSTIGRLVYDHDLVCPVYIIEIVLVYRMLPDGKVRVITI